MEMFDHYDFMFLDGDPNILPWSQKAEDLVKLMKSIKQTNKVSFVSGVGLLLLAYYCASNLALIWVMNGHGKGTSLSEIDMI